MLSRIISRTQFRQFCRTLSPFNHSQTPNSKLPFFPFYPHHFCTNNNKKNGGDGPDLDIWKMSDENDNIEDIFGTQSRDEDAKGKGDVEEPKQADGGGWALGENADTHSAATSVFDDFLEGKTETAETGVADFEPWQFGVEDPDGKADDVFGIGADPGFGRHEEDASVSEETEMIAAAHKAKLQKEQRSLLEVIKGPDRAFGDLVAASGITDAMLDTLIALKNFQDIEGLPPLKQIEDDRYLKTLMKSSRYEMELQKQEDAAKARVRKVDHKGRAYGTGKRKCSIARVWIQPGDGQILINDKEIDVYFPMLDHRAALLRPFSETKTLGLWDVNCTVKGGGTTGQVGAIRLGVSRALQNWEPGLRPPLKEAGFLTRDPRIVERKKPGKAKARKSYQWVKR